MVIRATNDSPVGVYAATKQFIGQIKTVANNYATQFAVSGGDAEEVLLVLDRLNTGIERLNSVKNVGGIAAYAREQENNQGYDVVAEFNSLIALLEAARATIVTTLPESTNGFTEVFSLNSDGTKTYRTFTVPQLSSLTTDLQNIDVFIV